MSERGKRAWNFPDGGICEPSKRLKLSDDSGKLPLPQGAILIDLTSDNDEPTPSPTPSPLPTPSKKPKTSEVPRKAIFDDPWVIDDSEEEEDGTDCVDFPTLDEIDLDEPWIPQRKRRRELSDDSMFVDPTYGDEIQSDTMLVPDDDVVISGLRLSVLQAAATRALSSPTPTPPVSPMPVSGQRSSNGTTELVYSVNEGFDFGPTHGSTPEFQPRKKGAESYDTCFGMLRLDVQSCLDAELPSKCSPATITFNGSIANLQLEGGNRCIGILVSEPLSMLLNNFTVTLTATVCGKKLKPASPPKKPRGSDSESPPPEPRSCPARIIVYGLMNQRDAVADALSQAELFLQHPGESEFDNNVKYFNPQYLLPPGEDMPEISTLRISMCCKSQSESDLPARSSLGELERSQLLKIFDTTYESLSLASIEPSPRLRTDLKKHQLEALVMMVEKEAGIYDDASFPPLWKPSEEHKGRYQHAVTGKFEMQKPPPVGGGILADEMGLGKTLSTLSLICYSLDAIDKLSASSQRKIPRATLVVAPKSTLYGWEKQIKTHIREGQVQLVVYHGQDRHRELHKRPNYNIVLTTYETLRSDGVNNGPLLNQEWARVVLDEAHKIRNRSSKIYGAVFKIKAQKRWCLTGTPIQNSLDDFGALLAFIGVPPFNTDVSLDKYIRNSGSDSDYDLDLMRTLVATTTLRRTKANHADTLELPKKTERVETVEFSPRHRRLYEFFKRRSYLVATFTKSNTTAKKGRKQSGDSTNILVLIGLLRLICNHDEALMPDSAIKAWKNRDAKSIDWEMLECGVKKCVSCSNEVESLDTTESALGEWACGHAICDDCAAKSQATSDTSCPRCGRSASSPSPPPSQTLAIPTPLRSPSISVTSPRSPFGVFGTSPSSQFKERYVPSDKVEALLRNIEGGREKHVIFSYWTKMLDQIATAVKSKGLKFKRIDGQCSLEQRKDALEKFSSDPNYIIMLASIGAAGEGIDLTAATTVHLVEPHWNPMAEAQAIDRVHRIGQQKDVTVIRYVMADSIEAYVQWVQADKLRLIKDSFSVSERDVENVTETRWNRLMEHLQ